MVNYRQFLSDAEHATHGQGIDTEPVCYMGDAAYTELIASVTPGCPAMLDARSKRVSGIEVYIVRQHPDHYHMTFRRMRI